MLKEKVLLANRIIDDVTDTPVTANQIITTANISGLKSIQTKGVGAVILQRDMPAHFQSWITQLSPNQLPSIRKIVPIQQTKTMLQEEMRSVDPSAKAEVEYLINDAHRLAQSFAKILHCPYVRIRFDVVDDNACGKFHLDKVSARLICTYRGRGTQYGEKSPAGDPDIIHETQTGQLIVLRGSQWENDSPSGIVHRSPPIEGTGETRLLLVIDPITDPQNEA